MNRTEREIRRRRRRRIADLNRNDHQIFTMMLRITLFAVGFIICAAIFFWSASKAAEEVQAAVLRSHRITDGPLYGPQITMVEPLPEFLPEDGEPPEAIEIKHASKADAVPEGKWESLGVWKLTFYCKEKCCNGKNAHRTASGAPMVEGRTVAVGGLPFGTELMIDGHVYVVEDRGVHGNHVDILVSDHQTARKLGVQYKEVFIRR